MNEEYIQISSHDLIKMAQANVGDYSVDVMLATGDIVHIEMGDVDNMLVFKKDES